MLNFFAPLQNKKNYINEKGKGILFFLLAYYFDITNLPCGSPMGDTFAPIDSISGDPTPSDSTPGARLVETQFL